MWHRQSKTELANAPISPPPAAVQSDGENHTAPPTDREDKTLKGAERSQEEERVTLTLSLMESRAESWDFTLISL